MGLASTGIDEPPNGPQQSGICRTGVNQTDDRERCGPATVLVMSCESVPGPTGCLLIRKPTGREHPRFALPSADRHQRKAGRFDGILSVGIPPRTRDRILLPKEIRQKSPTDDPIN